MMPWEDVDINSDEPESIDEIASDTPDGWEKTHIGMRTYRKSYDMGIDVEIFVLEDYDSGKYTINPVVKDSDSDHKLSERSYTAESKESMEQFVGKLLSMYDETFDKKEGA